MSILLYKVRAAGEYLNSATVTWELLDSNGSQVATGSATYQTGSNGTYLGTIESTTTSGLTLNATYTLVITLSSGSINDEQRIDCVAKYRGTS